MLKMMRLRLGLLPFLVNGPLVSELGIWSWSHFGIRGHYRSGFGRPSCICCSRACVAGVLTRKCSNSLFPDKWNLMSTLAELMASYRNTFIALLAQLRTININTTSPDRY